MPRTIPPTPISPLFARVARFCCVGGFWFDAADEDVGITACDEEVDAADVVPAGGGLRFVNPNPFVVAVDVESGEIEKLLPRADGVMVKRATGIPPARHSFSNSVRVRSDETPPVNRSRANTDDR